MSEFPKTIKLRDGRTVVVERTPKVKDMKQVKRGLFGDELKEELTLITHLMARVCLIDGVQATTNDMDELDLADFPTLVEAVFEGNVPSA